MEFDGNNWTNGGSGGPSHGARIDANWDPSTNTIAVIGVSERSRYGASKIGIFRYDGTQAKLLDLSNNWHANAFSNSIVFNGKAVVVGGSSLYRITEYTAPNSAPTLGYIGKREIYPNETFSITIEPTDPDGHDVTVTPDNLPDGAEFDPATNTFTWEPRPDQGGEYTVNFTVSDGALTATQPLELKVEGLISYAMLPQGNIDMSTGVSVSGTIRERRRNGYEHRVSTFRVKCDFTGTNPGRVVYTCQVLNSGRWPYDFDVFTSGQLRPDGKFGNTQIWGEVQALQWDDYEVAIKGFDVWWNNRQENWIARGEYRGYLTAN
jgi:hypothetical protein